VSSPRLTGAVMPNPAMRVGAIELIVLSDGLLRIPAEPMRGAVPAAIAAQHLEPDAGGDVWLGLNCVLVRTPDHLVLVDTGFGDGPLAADPDLVRGAAGLSTLLRHGGIARESVDVVINTHLHADHIGGNLAWDGDQPKPAFPNAEYVIQADELSWAQVEDPRDAMLYVPDEVRVLAAVARVRAVDGDVPVVPGIRVRTAPGHSPGHQIVIVESNGESAAIVGDLAPLLMHVRHPGCELPGDLDPALAVRSRTAIVGWAADAGVALISYHEPMQPFIRNGERA
jgi:glyoxylase-like metal-dependent hydrolase (beta-lactamase superfamily II)